MVPSFISHYTVVNVLPYKLSFWEYVVIDGRITPKKNPVEFDMYKSLR